MECDRSAGDHPSPVDTVQWLYKVFGYFYSNGICQLKMFAFIFTGEIPHTKLWSLSNLQQFQTITWPVQPGSEVSTVPGELLLWPRGQERTGNVSSVQRHWWRFCVYSVRGFAKLSTFFGPYFGCSMKPGRILHFQNPCCPLPLTWNPGCL